MKLSTGNIRLYWFRSKSRGTVLSVTEDIGLQRGPIAGKDLNIVGAITIREMLASNAATQQPLRMIC